MYVASYIMCGNCHLIAHVNNVISAWPLLIMITATPNKSLTGYTAKPYVKYGVV